MNIAITMPDLEKEGVKSLVRFYKRLKGLIYFRVPFVPKQIMVGERCLVVSNGILIGSHEIVAMRFVDKNESIKISHGEWEEGIYLIREASSFKEIKDKIKVKGFRGFRYLNTLLEKIGRGEWKDE